LWIPRIFSIVFINALIFGIAYIKLFAVRFLVI
jgi:hypothetical protein